ncbi:MAG: 50S ribosomal protein L4 [Chloroflexota bacterium]|nr:MAG: 50S ribosomal protein L4 [Chloroflexota bacterium]
MEANIINMKGEKVDTIDLPVEIFGAPVRIDLMHQAFVRQMANKRLGLHSTKGRSEVAGGGRKPWRQKGTGRARQGSTRAAQWVGGGKIFTPKPRSYEKKMPRKMRRAALCSALSVKLASEEMLFVDEFSLESPKTRLMAQALSHLAGEDSVLLIFPEKNEAYEFLGRAIRNLPNAKLLLANYLNVRDLLQYGKIIVVRPSLDVIFANLQQEQNNDLDL